MQPHISEIDVQTPRESNAATPELPNIPPRQPLVLLAEDEPIVREYMASLLQEQGYKVLQAADGEEALSIFKGIPGMMIDLLLTDIVMPKMTGKELAYRIGTLSPGTKIIFCSAYPEKLASLNGIIDTRIPFLQKPVTANTLAAKVREVIDAPEQDLLDEEWLDGRPS
jgi:two-component system, cell cycle sensor histidine kinase and response regulator CckA